MLDKIVFIGYNRLINKRAPPGRMLTMKKSVITVKRMIETYVAYGLSEDTWKMFYNMYCHNLITNDDWNKFFNTCRGLQFDNDDNFTIIDTDNNDIVVYEADEYGMFHKVK